MPSPFPGMDPYLEYRYVWPGVNQTYITYLSSALNAVLPERYVADIGERLYLDGMREVFVKILAIREENREVTVIEVLSPDNKMAGSEGAQLYSTRQRDILASHAHLIEIDLLRQGEHTVAAPLNELLKMERWDYLVCLRRGGDGTRFELWPIRIRNRLPRIRVPLSHGDPDVILDLQAVFQRCYDEGGYARWIDYGQDPGVPFGSEDAAWARTLLSQGKSA